MRGEQRTDGLSDQRLAGALPSADDKRRADALARPLHHVGEPVGEVVEELFRPLADPLQEMVQKGGAVAALPVPLHLEATPEIVGAGRRGGVGSFRVRLEDDAGILPMMEVAQPQGRFLDGFPLALAVADILDAVGVPGPERLCREQLQPLVWCPVRELAQDHAARSDQDDRILFVERVDVVRSIARRRTVTRPADHRADVLGGRRLRPVCAPPAHDDPSATGGSASGKARLLSAPQTERHMVTAGTRQQSAPSAWAWPPKDGRRYRALWRSP